jgi:hypothetical protein
VAEDISDYFGQWKTIVCRWHHPGGIQGDGKRNQKAGRPESARVGEREFGSDTAEACTPKGVIIINYERAGAVPTGSM